MCYDVFGVRFGKFNQIFLILTFCKHLSAIMHLQQEKMVKRERENAFRGLTEELSRG
jgi:hypothetical protein